MFDINKLHPIELHDLVRVGNHYDGGYILSRRQIHKTSIVLSFGIRDDWTFEQRFLENKKDIEIYSYDYSTQAILDAHLGQRVFRFFYYLMAGMYHLARFCPSRSVDAFKKINFAANFYSFFDKKERFYIPKFIGTLDDGEYICFDTVFKGISNYGGG